jgi:hypothetical protein
MGRLSGTIVAMVALMSAPLLAQDDVKQQLDALRKEVEALKAERVQNDTKALETPAAGKAPAQGEEMGAPQAQMNPLMTLFKETQISGFVDMGYNINRHQPANGVNFVRAFDTAANSFTLHNAQINLGRAATKEMIAGFKIEAGFGSDADAFDAAPIGDVDSFLLQEAYLEVLVPGIDGLTIRAGRMATLAGYEVFESHMNYNYSRALLFNWAIPFINTGVRAEYQLMDGMVTFTLGYVNGWDNQLDNNNAKTFEFQVAVRPVEGLLGSITLYHGAEQAGEDGNKRTLVDIVLSYTVQNFTIGANFDWGREEWDEDEAIHGSDVTPWNGYAFYLKYQATDWLAGALRFERLRDEEASRVGAAAAANVGAGAPIHASYWEITFTIELKPTDNLIFRIEYRYDESNKEVFLRHGSTRDRQDTIGFEAIVLF